MPEEEGLAILDVERDQNGRIENQRHAAGQQGDDEIEDAFGRVATPGGKGGLGAGDVGFAFKFALFRLQIDPHDFANVRGVGAMRRVIPHHRRADDRLARRQLAACANPDTPDELRLRRFCRRVHPRLSHHTQRSPRASTPDGALNRRMGPAPVTHKLLKQQCHIAIVGAVVNRRPRQRAGCPLGFGHEPANATPAVDRVIRLLPKLGDLPVGGQRNAGHSLIGATVDSVKA